MDYAIVGIFLNDFQDIKGGYIAEINRNNGSVYLSNFKAFSNENIIKVINNGHSVYTALWDYRRTQWKIGSAIHVYAGNSLRANPNCTLVDNLLSLPTFY
ncbi:MAG: hypothetical protein Q4A00_07585 [Flavobacteriaceae bacterium]|nr:hypothetical protein [Flavobacteriaceae bacterium]